MKKVNLKQSGKKIKKPNEPTLAQWKELYAVAMEVKKAKLWDYFWDQDLVAIKLPESDDTVYCSILGKMGGCFAVAVYIGEKGLLSYYSVAATNPEESPLHTAFDQSGLICHYGDREEVLPQERDIMKQLGLKFRGRNEWIYFKSLVPGFVPWHIDATEATLLTQVLQHLLLACKPYIEGELVVDFKNGAIIVRHFENNLWVNQADKQRIPNQCHYFYSVENEKFLKQINNRKSSQTSLELDVFYFPIPVQKNDDERPMVPLMSVLIEIENEVLYDQRICEKEDDAASDIMEMLCQYIEDVGKPEAIHVRDDRTGRYIRNFCESTGIELVKGQELLIMNDVLEKFLDFLEEN